MNNPEQKKVYTLEDNVKYISFGIKDLVKQMENLNMILQQLVEKKTETEDDKNPLPF